MYQTVLVYSCVTDLLLCPFIVIDCGEPMTITNGRVLYSTTFKDSLANYTCNDGYTLVGGDSQIRCTGYGKWVGQVPDCAGKYTILLIQCTCTLLYVHIHVHVYAHPDYLHNYSVTQQLGFF